MKGWEAMPMYIDIAILVALVALMVATLLKTRKILTECKAGNDKYEHWLIYGIFASWIIWAGILSVLTDIANKTNWNRVTEFFSNVVG